MSLRCFLYTSYKRRVGSKVTFDSPWSYVFKRKLTSPLCRSWRCAWGSIEEIIGTISRNTSLHMASGRRPPPFSTPHPSTHVHATIINEGTPRRRRRATHRSAFTRPTLADHNAYTHEDMTQVPQRELSCTMTTIKLPSVTSEAHGATLPGGMQ